MREGPLQHSGSEEDRGEDETREGSNDGCEPQRERQEADECEGHCGPERPRWIESELIARLGEGSKVHTPDARDARLRAGLVFRAPP